MVRSCILAACCFFLSGRAHAHVCCMQGQSTNCIYFVMSGVVEITKAPGPGHDLSGGGSMEHSFTIDIDESLTLDCADGYMGLPSGAINGRLHIDRTKVGVRHLLATLLMLSCRAALTKHCIAVCMVCGSQCLA